MLTDTELDSLERMANAYNATNVLCPTRLLRLLVEEVRQERELRAVRGPITVDLVKVWCGDDYGEPGQGAVG